MATTQVKDGFNGGSDNQLKVNNDGSINVNSGGGGSANVNIFDSAGNSLTSTSGALNVNINGVNPNQNSVLVFNEVSSVPVGIETTIATYTAPVGKTSCLLQVYVGGMNVAQMKVYNNTTIYDSKYTSAAGLNENFDFKTGSSIVPGQIIGPGNSITVTVNQIGTGTATFNARIQVLEIG